MARRIGSGGRTTKGGVPSERASERGPKTPFLPFSREQISFPFPGLSLSLSVRPPFLPSFPRHSLSHPLWNAARTPHCATGWHRLRILAIVAHATASMSRPSFWSNRPVVGRTRSLGQFCAFLRSLRPSPLRGEPFVFVHGRLPLLSPSPSAAADLSGSGLARVVGVTSLPKQSRAEQSRGEDDGNER